MSSPKLGFFLIEFSGGDINFNVYGYQTQTPSHVGQY